MSSAMRGQGEAILELVKRVTRFDGEVVLSMETGNQATFLMGEGDDALFYIAVDEGDLSVEAYVAIDGRRGQHTFFSFSNDSLIVIDDVVVHDGYDFFECEPADYRAAIEYIIHQFRLESNSPLQGAIAALRGLCQMPGKGHR